MDERCQEGSKSEDAMTNENDTFFVIGLVAISFVYVWFNKHITEDDYLRRMGQTMIGSSSLIVLIEDCD